MAGAIIEDSKDKEKCNYLVLSPAPNETIEQQRKVFECLEFKDFNVVILNGDNKNPEIKELNAIISDLDKKITEILKEKDKDFLTAWKNVEMFSSTGKSGASQNKAKTSKKTKGAKKSKKDKKNHSQTSPKLPCACSQQ